MPIPGLHPKLITQIAAGLGNGAVYQGSKVQRFSAVVVLNPMEASPSSTVL